MDGGLLWIPTALSTLKPSTSPRLSTIQLDFAHPPITGRSVQNVIEAAGSDLRKAADEVARIEREFGGAVSVNVFRDQGFTAVLDTLNVRFSLSGRHLATLLNSFSSISYRSFGIEIVEMGSVDIPLFCSIGRLAALSYSVMRAVGLLTRTLTSGFRALRLHMVVREP